MLRRQMDFTRLRELQRGPEYRKLTKLMSSWEEFVKIRKQKWRKKVREQAGGAMESCSLRASKGGQKSSCGLCW